MLAAAVVLLLLGLKPLLTRRADWRSRLGVGEEGCAASAAHQPASR